MARSRRRRNPSAAAVGVSVGTLAAMGIAAYFLFFRKKQGTVVASPLIPAGPVDATGKPLGTINQKLATLTNLANQVTALKAQGQPVPVSLQAQLDAANAAVAAG